MNGLLVFSSLGVVDYVLVGLHFSALTKTIWWSTIADLYLRGAWDCIFYVLIGLLCYLKSKERTFEVFGFYALYIDGTGPFN